MADKRVKPNSLAVQIQNELYSSETLRSRDRLVSINDRFNKAVSEMNQKFYNTGNIVELLSVAASKMKGKRGDLGKKNGKSVESVISDDLMLINDMFFQERTRILRYNDCSQIFELIPEMAEAAEALTNNILSSDLFGTNTMSIRAKAGIHDQETTRKIDEIIREVVKDAKIIQNSYEDVLNAVYMGDRFILMLDIDEELKKLLPEDQKASKSDIRSIQNTVRQKSKTLDFKNVSESELLSFVSESVKKSEKIQETTNGIRKFLSERFSVSSTFNPFLISEIAKDIPLVGSSEIVALTESSTLDDGSRIIVKQLQPDKVIKVTSGSTVIGYYYVETIDDVQFGAAHHMDSKNASLLSSFYGYGQVANEEQNTDRRRIQLLSDLVVRELGDSLNLKFLDQNPQFKELIYSILRDRDFAKKRVNITFIPPNKMAHLVIGGDPYGRSIYSKSLFFAKLYLATLMSSTMQGISKGVDEKVYYVETGLDEDIEGSIMGFIKDIKTDVFSVDSFGDISSSLRTASPFRQIFIPVVDGQKPVEMDSFQGSDVSIENEFLEFLKKAMISGTGVPEAYLGIMKEVDFARSLAMQNGNFARKVVRSQDQLKVGYKWYVYCLVKLRDSSIQLSVEDIDVQFAPPVSINNENLSNIVNSTSTFINSVVEGIAGDKASEPKYASLKMKLFREYLPQVPWDRVEQMLFDIDIELQKDAIANSAGPSSDMTAGGQNSAEDDEMFG